MKIKTIRKTLGALVGLCVLLGVATTGIFKIQRPVYAQTADLSSYVWDGNGVGDFFSLTETTDPERGEVYKLTATKNLSDSGLKLLYTNYTWEAGETYDITYYVKTTDTISTTFRFWPVVKQNGGDPTHCDVPGSFLAGTKLPTAAGSPVLEWKKFTKSFTADGSASNDFFGFYCRNWVAGDGVYLDDVTVTKRENAVTNGAFFGGTNAWTGIIDSNIIEDGGAEKGNALHIFKPAGQTKEVTQSGVQLTAEKEYTYSFYYRNDALFGGGDIGSVYLTDGTQKYGEYELLATNELWQYVTVNFLAPASNSLQLVLDCKGEDAISYHFSNFKIAQSVPVVQNGDFSSGTDGWWVQDTNSDESVYSVEEVPSQGKALRILKLTEDSDATDAYPTLGKLIVGRTYRFSGKVYRDGGAQHLIIRKSLQEVPIANIALGGLGAWTEFSYDFTVADGYESPVVMLRALRLDTDEGNVNAYFADFKVELTDKPESVGFLSNADFSKTTNNYLANWGILGTHANATLNKVGNVNVLSLQKPDGDSSIAGAATLTQVFAGYEHLLTFTLQADEAALEAFKVRVTPYTDSLRSKAGNSFEPTLQVYETDETGTYKVETIFTAADNANFADLAFIVGNGGSDALSFKLSSLALTLKDETQLFNFSFELGAEEPVNWTSTAGTMTLDSEITYDASKSKRSVKVDISGAGGALSSKVFSIKPSTLYAISYWVRADINYDGNIAINLKQTTADGQKANGVVYSGVGPEYVKYSDNLGFTYVSTVYGNTLAHNTRNGWVNVRGSFTTAADAAYAYIHIAISGITGINNVVWFDDITLQESSPSVSNLDFESYNADGTPKGWYLSTARDPDPQATVVSDVYHSGGHSLYLKTNTSLREQYVFSDYLMPLRDVKETVRQIYQISYWVSSRNSTTKSIELTTWAYDENYIKMYNASVSPLTAHVKGVAVALNKGATRSEWQKVTARISLPQGTKYAGLVFAFTEGAAEVWIDDIEVTLVETDDAVLAEFADFHAEDHDGKSVWTAVDGSLNQVENAFTRTKNTEGYYLGKFAGTGEVYARYTSKVLAANYVYSITVRYRSDYHLQLQLRFNDTHGKEYTESRITSNLTANAGWMESTVQFTSVSNTSCDILIGVAEGGDFTLSDIALHLIGKPDTEMGWKGKWIAYRADNRFCAEYSESYYRQTITLDQKATYAPLQLTGDDKIALWVNGQQVYSNIDDPTGSWSSIYTVFLEDYLVVGKNVLSFLVFNNGTYGGMVFDGRWTMEDGSTVLCISNGDTLCNGVEYADDAPEKNTWMNVDFDDSAWDSAFVIGDVGCNPWGAAYFDASLYIDNAIEVEVVEGEGKSVNDLIYEYTVKIKPEKEITSQLPFTMVVWRKNSTKALCTLTPKFIKNGDMRNWTAGEWNEVTLRVELPDYIASGNYTLQLDDTLFFIDNFYDNKFINFKVLNNYVAEEVVSKIETVNGLPTLTINGHPMPSMFFTASVKAQDASLETIADSGIETYVSYTVSLGKVDSAGTVIYEDTGSLNFDVMDKEVNSVVSASADAYVIFTINMYAPTWWLLEHPEEMVITMDINGNLVDTGECNVSHGSELWMQTAGDLLVEVLEHMKEQDYYARIAGVRLNFGRSCEWITFASAATDSVPDYSIGAQQYFRKYLKSKYGTVENLIAAWNGYPVESFETVELPTFKELQERTEDIGYSGMYYDPVTQQRLIDFRLSLGEMSSDNLLYWAKIAKEVTENKLVVGAYNGYQFMGSVYSGAGIEHTAFYKLLESDLIDFFISPVGYGERQFGESIYTQAVMDTIRAYGKLIIAEQDNRTVLSSPYAGNIWDMTRDINLGNTHTMEDSVLQEKANSVFNMVNGNAFWFYDMFGGWIADDQLYQLTNELNDELNLSNYLYRDVQNDIAIILNDDQTAYLKVSDSQGNGGVLSNELITGNYAYKWMRKELAKIGDSYDVYSLSTLVAGKMPKHKINVFMSSFMLSTAEREAIDTYCKNDGQINVFVFMDGFGDENGYDLAKMEELTGFEMALGAKGVKNSGRISVTNDTSPVTKGIELGTDFGSQISTGKYYLQEIYIANTEGIEVLGTLVDTGNPGFAYKDMGEWSSVYCVTPIIPYQVFRNLIEMQEGHIYSADPADVVWSNSAYVGVHSSTPGQKNIQLDGYYAVYDVFEKKYVSLNTNVITYEHSLNDTHLFRLTAPNTYTLFSIVKGGHGSIQVGGADATGVAQLAVGESRTLSILPDAGYMVKSVTINGEEVEVGENNELTIENIEDSKSVVVRFKRLPVVPKTVVYEEVYIPAWAMILILVGVAAVVAAPIVWIKMKKKGGR